MKNEAIMKAAIEKAEASTFKWKNTTYFVTVNNMEIDPKSWYQVIFSHDFAKAFWGTAPIYEHLDPVGQEFKGSSWMYHLQQMVLEEDPLKYLERFIGESQH